MIIFILRRLLLMLITLFFLSLLSFSLSYLPANAPLSGATLTDALVFYYNGLLSWDFGSSVINGEPVSQQLWSALPPTLELCGLAFLFALVIGIPAGIIAGVWRNKAADVVISTFALVGFSIPVFGLALLLTLFFSLRLDWLPVSGRIDLLYDLTPVTGFAIVDAWLSDSPYRQEMIVNVLSHMVLPVLTLSIAPMTEVIRLMRTSTEDVINENYIKAAAIRGLSRLTIVRRHLLHNALPPVIPKLGLQFSTMLTLAMVTEVVFNWPGIGRWLITAIRQQDFSAISAGVMLVGSMVIIINMLSDILGAISNPLKHKEWYAFR